MIITNIKSVDLYVPYVWGVSTGRYKWRVEYKDGTVLETIGYHSPSEEVDRFCAKAHADLEYSFDGNGNEIKHVHYFGKHAYFN